MRFLQLCLLMIGAACSTARQTVQVELLNYNNLSSEDCDGGNCEGVPGGTCDNIFQFCLREVGGVSCLSTITTSDIEDDSFTFTQSALNDLGISNPILFDDIQINLTGVELELFININDEDVGDDDLVDQITIHVGQVQNLGSLGPATTYPGSCGRARITVRIGITCIGNFVPPACEQCLVGFQAPNCVNCAPDYYPSGTCDTFCQPRNDTLGHFTCNSFGRPVCLPGFTDPDTGCVRQSEGESSSDEFVGSPAFYAVIGIAAGVPLLALSCIVLILCGLCLLSNDINCDCSCPKIDCSDSDCCRSFFKWLTCGLKCEDNLIAACMLITLAILAAPVIILVCAILLPLLAIGACLLYTVAHACD